MRLHPSLLIGGLLFGQAFPLLAEGQGSKPTDKPAAKPAAGAKPPAAPATRTRAPRPAPPNVDPQVLEWVKQTFPTVKKADERRKIAAVLTAIKADTGAWYQRSFEPFLKQQGVGAAQNILKHAAAARNAAQFDEAAANVLVDALGQKDQAGAPLLPMPPGNSRLRAGRTIPGREPPAQPRPGPAPVETKPDVPTPPAPKPVEPAKPGDEPGVGDDAEREFARLLKASPELQAMAAARITRFIWEQHGDISFLAAELKDPKNEPIVENWRKGTQAAVLKWVENRAVMAGLLVRFLGVPEGERPASAKEPAVAAHLKGAGKEQELAKALDRWSRSGGVFSVDNSEINEGASPGVKIDFPISPLGVQLPVPWFFAFLKDAFDRANTLRHGTSLPDARDNVGENANEGDDVPGGGGVGRDRIKKGPWFTPAELYGQEGDPGVFRVARKAEIDSGAIPRTLSVRIVTEGRSATDKALIDKIAIYDITPGGRIYGKTFPVSFSGKFQLKDGGREYTFGRDDKGNITLKADDGAVAQTTNGKPNGPTVDQLVRARAVSAQARASIVNIAGSEYYVWAQGTGQGGANIFLPKQDLDDGLRDGDPAGLKLRPGAMAYVNENVDGVDRLTTDINGKVALIGVDGNRFRAGGEEQHLWWNGKTYVVKKGPGPKEPPAETKPPAGGGTGGGTTAGGGATEGGGTTPGGGDQQPPAPGRRDSDGWPIIRGPNGAEIPYDRNPPQPLNDFPKIRVQDLNAKLAEAGVPAAVAQIDFNRLDRASLEGVRHFYAVIFKDGPEGRNHSSIPWMDNWKTLVNLEVVGATLVVESDVEFMYIDLAAGLVEKPDGDAAFDTVGQLGKGGGAIKGHSAKDEKTSSLVLDDILRRSGTPNRDVIRGKVEDIVKSGLAVGDKVGNDTLTVAIPKGSAYRLDRGGKEAPLILTFTEAKVSIRLAPTLGLDKDPGSRPSDGAAAGGQGTYVFDKPSVGELWDGWGPEMKIDGADATLLDKSNLNVPGARLYYAAKAKDGDKEVERWYLRFTIEQEGKPTITTLPKLIFQKPEGVKYAPPSDPKTMSIGYGGVKLPKEAPAITVTNLMNGELVAPYNQGPAKGLYVVSDVTAGKTKTCIGKVMWWGIPATEADQAARKFGCPATPK